MAARTDASDIPLGLCLTDLCLAAGLPPAALLCELVDSSNESGGIASRDACFHFARQHDLKVITIESLEVWRSRNDGAQVDVKLATDAVSSSSSTVTDNKLDQERGVRIEKQDVVGPAHAT